MDSNYEFILTKYEFPEILDDVFEDSLLYLELFSSKSTCAYDIHTDEVRLIRKFRRQVDTLIEQELNVLAVQICTNGIRPLVALAQCIQKIETDLQESGPCSTKVIFGSLGIEGRVKIMSNRPACQQYEDFLLNECQRFLKEECFFLENEY